MVQGGESGRSLYRRGWYWYLLGELWGGLGVDLGIRRGLLYPGMRVSCELVGWNPLSGVMRIGLGLGGIRLQNWIACARLRIRGQSS